MRKVIIYNIKKLFFIILGTSFLTYLIIHSDQSIYNILTGYFKWVFNFLIGQYGQSVDGSNIILFSFKDTSNTISIGPKYLLTLFTTVLSIILAFSTSLFLNYFVIVKKSSASQFVKNIIEWLSTIHVLIIGIIIYSIYQNEISYLLGIIIIAIGSNAFYELSSLQSTDMSELNSKDFIIAARAWGDNVWKHMRRSFTINSINQLFSLWIIFFSNCMIFEMIFQKSGLGYLLWKYFLDNKSYTFSYSSNVSSTVPESNIFLAISMLVIITICSMNTLRVVLLKYLMEFKR